MLYNLQGPFSCILILFPGNYERAITILAFQMRKLTVSHCPLAKVQTLTCPLLIPLTTFPTPSFQLFWISFGSLNRSGSFQPQAYCTCYFFCLDHVSIWVLCGKSISCVKSFKISETFIHSSRNVHQFSKNEIAIPIHSCLDSMVRKAHYNSQKNLETNQSIEIAITT